MATKKLAGIYEVVANTKHSICYKTRMLLPQNPNIELISFMVYTKKGIFMEFHLSKLVSCQPARVIKTVECFHPQNLKIIINYNEDGTYVKATTTIY